MLHRATLTFLSSNPKTHVTALICQYDVDTRTKQRPIQMLLKHHTRRSDVARVRRSCIECHIDDGMLTLPGLQKLGGQCGDCISGRLCHARQIARHAEELDRVRITHHNSQTLASRLLMGMARIFAFSTIN